MDSAAFMFALVVCVCFLSSAFSGTIKILKRSTEENNNAAVPQESGLNINVDDQFNADFNPTNFGLQHILPIWWNYFRPLVEITLRDDQFRQELQNQFQQEDRSVGNPGNDDRLGETEEVRSIIPTVVDDLPATQATGNMARTADISEKEDAGILATDDQNEVPEVNSINEGFHFDNRMEHIPDQSSIEKDDVISPKGFYTEPTSVETKGNEGAGETITDDAVIHRVDDSMTNMLSDHMSVSKTLTDFDTHSPLRTMIGMFSEFTESTGLFGQSQRDESDVAQSVETNTNTDDAGWDSQLSGRDFDRTTSGFSSVFDDRGIPLSSHNGLMFNNDDNRWIVEQSEPASNFNDGRFATNTWLPNAAEDSMVDSDNIPSFTTSGPFFGFMTSHHDSSS